MNNFKDLRLKQGLSIAQLAEFLHIGAGTVARWESHDTTPTLAQFLKLCHFMQCTPAQLCGLTDNEIPLFTDNITTCSSMYLTAEMLCDNCSFGLVLPYDISERFVKGDTCLFSFDRNAEADSLVFAIDDNYNEFLYIYKEYDANLQIIAICRQLLSSF